MEENRYKAELDRVYLTEDAKRALARRLENAEAAASAPLLHHRLSRTAVCLIGACAVLVTLCAAAVMSGTLRDFWGTDAAVIYDDNHQALNRSQTIDGWTVTLTDAVCDAQHAYIGFTVEPPPGEKMQATLKWPNPETGEMETHKADYIFDDYSINSVTREDVVWSWGARELSNYGKDIQTQKTDDSKRYFAFSAVTGEDFNHDTYDITLSKLYHLGDWDPTIRESGVNSRPRENGWYQEIMDVPGTFTFQNVRIDCPDTTTKYSLNQTVPLFDGKSTLVSADISPLSMTLHFEGGAAFNLHDRDTVWKVDGLCSCTHPITLYFTDGTSQSLETVNVFEQGKTTVHYTKCGSGTSNDHDAGTLDFVYKFDTLISPETLDHITIGDVVVPLK